MRELRSCNTHTRVLVVGVKGRMLHRLEMASQFAGEGCVLQQPNTVAFMQEKELGPGLLAIDER